MCIGRVHIRSIHNFRLTVYRNNNFSLLAEPRYILLVYLHGSSSVCSVVPLSLSKLPSTETTAVIAASRYVVLFESVSFIISPISARHSELYSHASVPSSPMLSQSESSSSSWGNRRDRPDLLDLTDLGANEAYCLPNPRMWSNWSAE